MNMTKRGLGRGLDALLATSAKAQARLDLASEENIVSQNELQHLPLSVLQQGMYQPRQEMAQDALEELAESIRVQGIIQPLVVRQIGPEKYEIIAGERRFRASKMAGLNQVPCLVRELDDKAASAIALIENIQREDLNAMEEAQALHRLVQDFTLTHQQIAEILGKSRASISNLLRLNGLEESVKKLLLERKIEMGHARALLGLEGEAQINAAIFAVKKKLTVRQTEALVKKTLTPIVIKEKRASQASFSTLQDRLSQKLGSEVTLSQTKGGKGKIQINFEHNDALEHILAILGEQL